MTTNVELAIQLGWKEYKPYLSENANTANARNFLLAYYTANQRKPYTVLISKQRDYDEAGAERHVGDGAARPVKQ